MKDKDTFRGKRQNIGGDEVHGRLDLARASSVRDGVATPESRMDILRERARVLAQEEEKDDSGDQMEIVEFLLAYEKYGIESSFVREVYPLRDLTAVPCTPAHVLGIVNVRGRILSVIDLKKFFDLPDKGLGDLNKVIILRSEDMEFGILADVIAGVRLLPLSSLQRDMPTLTGIRAEYLRGIAEDRTIILDGARILSDGKIVVNEDVTS